MGVAIVVWIGDCDHRMTDSIRPESAGENRAAILAEARKLGVDVLYSEKGHFAAATAWRTRNYWLGVPAALIGAAAGATILASAPPALSGVLALVGAAITALMTFLNPSERAAQHHRAGVSYGQLRRLIRQFAQIDVGTMLPDQARKRLTELTDEVGAAQREALPIPSRAYAKAYKSIQEGSADYADGELNAAVGPIDPALIGAARPTLPPAAA